MKRPTAFRLSTALGRYHPSIADEGYAENADRRDFSETGKTQGIGDDCSPRFESKVLRNR
ncbi:MAG TPA: hypothetical protein PL044_02120 [Clostridiales bacterium]|nr:hypothetical protein [Clostridiales bacterium]HQK72564.1 hypothetical protein [Clostridiales bacterium]